MKKRILSLLLALVMVFGMVPTMVHNADAYEEKIWKVYDFDALKAALESPKAEEVYVMKQIIYTYTYEDSINGVPVPEIHVQGNKTLYTQGFAIACIDESNINLGGNQNEAGLERTLIIVEKDATLIIDAPNGNADWDYEGVNYYHESGIYHGGAFLDKSHHYKKIVRRNLFEVYGTLVLNDGNYRAGGVKDRSVWLWLGMDEKYDALWGNVLTVRDGGHAILNNASLAAYGADKDMRNIVVYADKGSTLDINKSEIYGILGARPMAAVSSTVRIRGGIFTKRDANDLRIMSSEDPYKTKDFDADPKFGIPNDAWKPAADSMTIVLYDDDGNQTICDDAAEKAKLDLYADYPELTVAYLYYSNDDLENGKIQSDVTNNGVQVGEKDGYADTITFNPKTGTAKLKWNREDFYVSNEYNPNHGTYFRWRIWKGTVEDYASSDYIYTPPQGMNTMYLEGRTDIPWEESPIWTIECQVTEYLDIRNRAGECRAYTDMITVKIDALSFATQTPSMGSSNTMNYTYNVGDSAKFGFTAAELPAAWKKDGYTVVASQELYKGGVGLYKGNGSTIDLKDYIKEPGSYILWQWLDLRKGNTSVGSLRKLYYINAVGAPKVLSGSVHYTSAVAYDTPVTIGFKGDIANISYNLYQYQWQTRVGETWVSIQGANKSSYTPVASDKTIRVKVTVDGYEGALYSEAREVSKKDNQATPVQATMTSSDKTVTITNYNSNQEYVYSTKPLSAATWSDGTAISGKTFTVPEYGTYYVYTRFKETATTNAGLNLAVGWITPSENGTGEAIKAWKLYYPEFPTAGDTVFVPLGETVTIQYALNPTNANYDLPTLKSNDTSILTLTQNASAKTITVTGKKAGSTYVMAVNGSGYNWYDHPNKSVYNLTVRVVDMNNLGYRDFDAEANYPNISLTVGDTYTPDDPANAGIAFNPVKASTIFKNYRWAVAYSTMTGFYYSTTDSKGIIEIDPVSGEVTAKKAGQATVYLFAVKDEDKNSIPTTAMNYIGYYTVTVEPKPEIPVEEVMLYPTELHLAVGETYEMQAAYSPYNATLVPEVTASSSNEAVATFTTDMGIVTAKSVGVAVVKMHMGDLFASCTVVVYDSAHVHEGNWIDDGSTHYCICTICGKAITEDHTWSQWIIDKAADCENPGTKSRTCSLCGKENLSPISALGHIDSGWVYDENVHWVYCLRESCGKLIREKEAHEFNENGICTTCNYEKVGITDVTPLCPKDQTCPMAKFTDLDRNSWYHDGVHFCIEKGLMNGVSTTLFDPDSELSRAMVVTILYRMAGSPTVNGTSPFTDVASGTWYHDPVTWAAANGIAKGVTTTSFEPDSSVTREQTAAFLCRYAEYIGMDTSQRADLAIFPDAKDVSSYARDYISWAVATGLINGIGKDGVSYLAPTGTATRAQYATICYRFLTK